MSQFPSKLRAKLPALDPLRGLTPDEILWTRLGGLTNHNYLLDTPRGRFVLRLAGPGTQDYIDRAAESHNARVAARAGVNAEVLFFDESDGTMLCRYLDKARPTSMDSLRDLEQVRRVARAFRRLHHCQERFHDDFDLFAQLDRYSEVLRALKAPVPDGYAEVKAEARRVRAALSLWPVELVPCHCDPLYENLLDDGNTVHIIDFEYAGNNDPMWDLGDLSVEACFTSEQDDALLESYFGHQPSPFARARMEMYKALCDLLWTLWAVLQHANNNPAEDFWSYAESRLQRCRSLMRSKEFQRQLEIVKAGPLLEQYSDATVEAYRHVWGQDFLSPGGAEAARLFAARLGLPAGSRVLDVCCGLGGTAFLMAREFDYRVQGIDLAPQLIERARLRAKELDLSDRIHFVTGDCLSLERPSTPFDAVHSRDAFLHIHKKELLFETLRDCLKRGGTLLFTDYVAGPRPWSAAFLEYQEQRNYHLLTMDDYRALLEKVGFKEVRSEDLQTLFIQYLEKEIAIIENAPQSVRKTLRSGWEAKLDRARRGEQRWALFSGQK